jgi:histidine triad (HIT) family protein
MGDDCIFCEIARGEAPALIVDENELAFALLDIQALSEGHCLVVPRRHVPWWDGLPAVEADAVFRLAHATAGRIRRAFSPDCVTMYARGRRVPHTHIFLVPTFKDDPLDRVFNALEGFQEQAAQLTALRGSAEMREACERLRNA